MDIFKFIVTFILLIAISVIFTLFSPKIEIKKIYKTIITGFVFGFLSILCNWFNINDFLNLSNSTVLVAGLMFDGVSGLIACLLSALERCIFAGQGLLEITKISAPLCILICGCLSYIIRRFVVEKTNTKFYFGFVVGAIIQILSILIIFLTHLSDPDSVYETIKTYGLIDVLLNSVSVGLVVLLSTILLKKSLGTKEGHIGIQLKTQISLWMTIIVGLVSVTNIAFGVLNNNASKERNASISLAINDVENNIEADVDNDLGNYIQKITNQFKGGSALSTKDSFEPSGLYPTWEDYISIVENRLTSLKTTVIFTYVTFPTDLTIINADGTIYASTDPFMMQLSNISEFNIKHLEMLETYSLTAAKTLALPFEYNEQKGEKLKIIQKQHSNDFYFLITFNENAYHDQILESFNKGLGLRRLGENGYLIITDSENNVVSSPTADISGQLDLNSYSKNQFITCEVNGEEYYSYIDDFVNYNVIGLMNKEESDHSVKTALKITVLSEFAVFIVIYVLIYLAILNNVINPLKRVNKTLDAITSGNLDEKVIENSSNELVDLSNDINSTVDSLKEYMGREAKLIKKDLDFAKNIQYSVLPKLTEHYKGNKKFDIFGSMNPAKEVGGDFYDFELLDSTHLFILIADVSGKGVPAAMFMMQSKTIIKTLVENSSHIDIAIKKANEKLCESNSAGMFVTCWCAVINLDTGVLEYVNAGHNPPLLKQKNGDFAYISSNPGFVLAGMDGTKYQSNKIQLESGDELFLYTDGITEAFSASNEMFGEARLLQCVNNIKKKNSNDFCDAVLNNVKEFTKEKEQSDDITMLHFMYK